ncbi:MAG: glycoside hydrolase family 99-like domain-containing protein [Dehalococcoidia bacterium]
MERILRLRIHDCVKRAGIFLVVAAFIAGIMGCAPDSEPIPKYDLTVSSTAGGFPITPGEAIFTYNEGTVVDLVATPDAGYRFVNWTGDVDTIADINASSTTITMNGNYSITANFQAKGYTRKYENIASADNMLIGAYYYPWYSGTTHWDEGYKDTPVLGEYNCRDEETINIHIDWATGHGVDAFIMSWWGPYSWEDVTLKNHFLKASLADEMEFCIHYETWGRLEVSVQGEVDLSNQSNRTRLIQDFKYLEETYFSDPGYLRIQGRPVVVIYLARTFVGDVEGAISELRGAMEEDVYLIADIVYWQHPYSPRQRMLMGQFDAITSYNMHASVEGIDDNFGDKFSQKYAEFLEVAEEIGVGFVPNLMPGFDDSPVRPEDANPVIVRSPERFEGFCDAVLRCLDPKLNAVFITSFNEWHEYTQIEPDENYGTTYLEIIREKLAGFL